MPSPAPASRCLLTSHWAFSLWSHGGWGSSGGADGVGGWTPPASVLAPKAHTLCDFLFNFTSPLVFMRVIYKGFAL